MRSINFEDWKKARKAKFRLALEVENSLSERSPGRRPRDPEKEELLIRLEKSRKEKMIASGKLEILGPRHYRWRIGK